jgi:hypothetical protein
MTRSGHVLGRGGLPIRPRLSRRPSRRAVLPVWNLARRLTPVIVDWKDELRANQAPARCDAAPRPSIFRCEIAR